MTQQADTREHDDLIEWQFVSNYAEFALAMNFNAITSLLEKARTVSDATKRKSVCLSGLQMLYSSYEDFAILLHAFKNRRDGKHLHLTIGVEDQSKMGSTNAPRIFKHFESARQLLDNFGFTSITYERLGLYLDINEVWFESHYRDIATSVKGLDEYAQEINIYKNKLKHGKPVIESLKGEGRPNDVLFLRWNKANELEKHWVKASLEQLENATKVVAKLYIRSLDLLWLFMLQYYPQHADKFRVEQMMKHSKECVEQVVDLGLSSRGLT